jgi:hypothetical protein
MMSKTRASVSKGKTRASVSRCGNCVYMHRLLKVCHIFGVVWQMISIIAKALYRGKGQRDHWNNNIGFDSDGDRR